MSKKAIVFFCEGSFTGGAQSRYINLIKYLSVNDSSYLTIINDQFYESLDISLHNNLVVIPLKYIYKNKNKATREENSLIAKFTKKERKLKLIYKNIVYMIYKGVNWIILALHLRKVIKKHQINTVYSIWKGGIFIWPLKYILKFKLIHSYNDSSLASLSKSILSIFDSEYWVLKFADRIDFLSPNYLKLLESKIGKIQESRISITPNSFIIYNNFYAEYPKENSVIFMSRLISYKNPMLFLEAVNILNTHYSIPTTRFLIIGDGPLESDISKFIEKNNLRNVQYIGKVNKSFNYLRKSKVFVSIQEKENYPSQSLLEAMACENAVIASDVGETRRIVSEKEGVLVPLIAENIAKALLLLLSDSKLTYSLGRNARAKVLKEHNIENYLKYFKEITNLAQ